MMNVFPSLINNLVFYISEMVEFQTSVDRRTGKPIAVSVIRADNEIINEAQVSGTVVSLTSPSKGQVGNISFYLNHFNEFFQPIR